MFLVSGRVGRNGVRDGEMACPLVNRPGSDVAHGRADNGTDARSPRLRGRVGQAREAGVHPTTN